MLVKSYPVRIKAAGDNDDGTFEAIVSVFGNVDSYGDVVVKGAFADTLDDWETRGDPIPVYWSHRMDDPDYLIGEVLEAREVDEGLWVKARLLLGDDEPVTSKARKVHGLLKRRLVTQFSFAYDVLDAGPAKHDGEDVFELRKLALYEVGPTPIGANQETELLAVKAAGHVARGLAVGVKEGRVLAAKHIDSLRTAQEAIGRVIDAAAATDDQAKHGKGPANDEAAGGGKSEEPGSRSLRVLAAQIEIEAAG
ncbi:HK97 family phage prohead protease [Georgenia sp. MJ170]|uniref:HK97 family phage prohead protease n=1 Tax=Georgenia sunbinii TaxID=3117728 RepID=UPI002F260E35